jgi:hypothetical protein
MIHFGQYSFKKELKEIDKHELLDNFERNFIRTGCHHQIHKNEYNLSLKNEWFDLNYMYKFIYPGHLWSGLGNININIQENKEKESFTVNFSISFLRQFIWFLIIDICAFSISFYESEFIIFLIFSILFLTSMFISFFLHRNFFFKTIKVGDFYRHRVLTNYNWEKLLKSKTDNELSDIINGNSFLPEIAKELAIKELNKRKEKN